MLRLMVENARHYIDAREVSQIIKVTQAHVHKMARNKKIPAYKLGGIWRFDKQEILEWVKKQGN